MRKDKPLTFTLHIGGKQVDTLTDEQAEKMAKRAGEALSRYYATRPDEFKKIKT